MRYLAIALTCCAIAWIASLLPSEYVRLKHQSTLQQAKEGTGIEKNLIDEAIHDYEAVSKYNFCHGEFFKKLSSFYIMQFAQHETENNLTEVDTSLSKALGNIEKYLECQPKDGNGWLTKAIIHIQRAGFNSDAMQAYKQSAKVAPREAWLAEKRILFSTSFFAIFDKEARAVAINDMKVLQKSSTNRQRKLRKKLGVDSLDIILKQMQDTPVSVTP